MVQPLGPGDPGSVGRYRLVSRLGRGGMGQVYLAQSPGGRLVAVKVIRAELAGDPEFRARFAREVATARTVSGIFTVPVVDADVDGQQPWLVTAYVEGPSLADAVREQGPMAPGQVLTLAAGLAEGLEVIHEAGVVHRDLKPSNVLLAPDGPRIIDFGISRAGDPGLTRTGWVAGSPGYMSPEQAEGAVAGPPSDIFSLGATLAHAATGREPFGLGSAPSILYRVVHRPPDTDGIAEPLRTLILRCTTKDPAQRPTAAQVVTELGAARPQAAPAGGNLWIPGSPPAPYQPTVAAAPRGPGTWPTGSADPPTLRQRSPETRRGQGRAWAAVAAVAVVVAGAVAAFALLRHPAPSPSAAPRAAVSATSPTSTPPSTPAPSPPPSGTSDWVRYTDPSGFSIKVPPGWTVTSTAAGEIRFTGPMPGVVIAVAWTTTPQSNALADWRQQSAAKVSQDPAYQVISIKQVSYRGWDAADWEFTDQQGGGPDQFLDRGFVVTPGALAYAIEIYGPTVNFAAAKFTLWTGLTTTFEPAT